jgi:hypothetical protein
MSESTELSRLEVIATGRGGILLGPAEEGYWSVILDGENDVTEFRLSELTILVAD